MKQTRQISIVRERHLVRSIPRKARLLRRKARKGFPMEMFFKKGHGLKTLTNMVGRLTDFKGIFVISSRRNRFLFLGSSEHVLRDIQQLVRGTRKKDEHTLKQIAALFGYRTALAGQQYLRSMRVNWLEITGEAERILLTRKMARRARLIES